MQLQLETSSIPTIQGHGAGWIMLAGQRLTQSLLILPDGRFANWDCATCEALREAHFARLLAAPEPQLRPEVVLFGSGARLRFPRPQWIRPLIESGIGVETMDTPAACRTWNILVSEGRRVAAGLIIEPAA
ncbi:MAG: Mth938-like domain-containing protein [Burkholderiaceae bacterium]|jgi:uncharacterized protein|nr:Mth938-like domain-containing protein [Burkholderiaceae bacterium]